MTEKRNVRAQEVRESVRDEESRPQTNWTPPALLDAPEPRSGYIQRWVATSIQGKDTPDKLFPTINHGQWEGCIGIEGMLLCEMPIEKHKQMKSYYANKSLEQNESLAGDLDALGRKAGQPIFQERKSSVSGGRQMSAMED